MFHVMYNLESRFASLSDALEYVRYLQTIETRVPLTHGFCEDATVPRVCVAPTVELCLTGIGAGASFRRCIGTTFENEHEAYPCIVCEVEGQFFQPDQDLVPDVGFTQEHWSLSDVEVIRAEVKWLGSNSVKVKVTGSGELVTSVQWLTDLAGYHHPWIDGKGHPLDCSYKGSDPWPPMEPVLDSIYLETDDKCKLVFIQPQLPPSGFCKCTPIDGTPKYKARLPGCRRFTGYCDTNGHLLFDQDICQVAGYTCRVTIDANRGFSFKVCESGKVLPFSMGRPSSGYRLLGVTSFEQRHLDVPTWLSKLFIVKSSGVSKMQL